jgi:hypothetical protein
MSRLKVFAHAVSDGWEDEGNNENKVLGDLILTFTLQWRCGLAHD